MSAVRFTCQPGCTNCCDQRGHVYLNQDDLERAAAFTQMDVREFEAAYVYRTRHQIRFRKPRKKQCPFLLDGGCSLHPAKPTQCRTFPFWPELLERKAAWNRTARNCPGIGQGPLIQIGTAMEIAEEQRKAHPLLYREMTR